MIGNFQVIGLIFDGVGILILGVPAVFRVIAEIKAQSGTYFSYNKYLAESLSIARVDLTIGSIALLAGFAFQLAGTIGYYALPNFGLSLLIAGVLFPFIHFFFLRQRLSALILAKVIKLHSNKSRG